MEKVARFKIKIEDEIDCLNPTRRGLWNGYREGLTVVTDVIH